MNDEPNGAGERARRDDRAGSRRADGSRRTTSRPRSRCSARCCCRATRSASSASRALQPGRLLQARPPAHLRRHPRAVLDAARPVDTVTVADELRRAGLLDEIGGAEPLHELQNATPAISNAGHYAKIVQDTALLRRLIYVAGDIAEIAYSEPDDVTKALDEAETKVFKVAEQRVTDSTRQLERPAAEAMDRLQETFDRGDTITGVATGYTDLDELLSGLQPSALNIVGARPAMGKCVAWDTPMVDLVDRRGGHRRRADGPRAASDVARPSTCCRSTPTARQSSVDRIGACLDDGIKPVFRVRTRSRPRASIDHRRRIRCLTGHGVGEPLESIRGRRGRSRCRPVVAVFGDDELADRRRSTSSHVASNPVTSCGARRVRARHVFRLLPRLRRPVPEPAVRERGDVVDGEPRVAAGSATPPRPSGSPSTSPTCCCGSASEPSGASGRPTAARRPSFEVDVIDSASLIAFADQIGIRGKDATVADRARARRGRTFGGSIDTVPVEVWDDVVKAKGELSWAELNRRCGQPRPHNWHRLPRPGVDARPSPLLAEALDDDQLRWWASPDVLWDEVVSRSSRPAGRRSSTSPCPGLHNFVAADFFLHNTAFGLGMADARRA